MLRCAVVHAARDAWGIVCEGVVTCVLSCRSCMRWEVVCFVVLIMLASASLVVGGAEVAFVEVSAWLWILLTSMRRLVEEGFEAGLVLDVRVLVGCGGIVA